MGVNIQNGRGQYRYHRHHISNLSGKESSNDFITKRCNTLLQNAAALFITKRGKSLLQNAAAFLLQNEPFLLQNAAGITKCAVFITKRGRYYKMSRLLQNAAQHQFTGIKFQKLY